MTAKPVQRTGLFVVKQAIAVFAWILSFMRIMIVLMMTITMIKNQCDGNHKRYKACIRLLNRQGHWHAGYLAAANFIHLPAKTVFGP